MIVLQYSPHLVVGLVTDLTVVVNDNFPVADLPLPLAGHVTVGHLPGLAPVSIEPAGHTLPALTDHISQPSHHLSTTVTQLFFIATQPLLPQLSLSQCYNLQYSRQNMSGTLICNLAAILDKHKLGLAVTNSANAGDC